MAKVSIIGAGFVGSTTAYVLAMRKLADEVVLVDIQDRPCRGKALDIAQATGVFGLPVRVRGGAEYASIADSDVVVITAGVPRKPDQKREDTLLVNAKIMDSVIENVKRHAPEAVLVVVTNPLDAMTWLAAELSGVDKRKVVGMAGTLDTARFKLFVSERLDVSPSKVEALVLGGHGDLMVPLSRLATVDGARLTDKLPTEELRAIEERTRHGGAEIVNLLGNGSAYYATAAAIFEVVEAILRESSKPVPVSAWLDGEYELKGLFLGVPCLLGKEGVREVVELPLDKTELAALHASAASVKKLVAELEKGRGA